MELNRKAFYAASRLIAQINAVSMIAGLTANIVVAAYLFAAAPFISDQEEDSIKELFPFTVSITIGFIAATTVSTGLTYWLEGRLKKSSRQTSTQTIEIPPKLSIEPIDLNCLNCKYYSYSAFLSCAVNPTKELGVPCKDFDPRC